MNHDTIAAICTPAGMGGIGIIRISGTRALEIASKLFCKSGDSQHCGKTGLKSRRAYVGNIIDPESRITVDEVVLLVMKSPKSYTREDVVEIQAHSGSYLLKRILELILSLGARQANPGEFTLRAFLNGRIDLTQAEAVIDLIQAKGETSLQAANLQLQGGLKRKIDCIKGDLVSLRAQLEALIDFPEDVFENGIEMEGIRYLRKHGIDPLKRLLETHGNALIFTESIKIGIVGKPNVGKSTLFNRVIQKDKAIVTAIPGTTRDVIEQEYLVQGVSVRLHDTAGIRRTKEEIEKIGMTKTRDIIERSHFILLVIDKSSPVDENDLEVLESLKEKSVILVNNKSDLPVSGGVKQMPDPMTHLESVSVSALTGEGFKSLYDLMIRKINGLIEHTGGIDYIPNMRHKNCLEDALKYCRFAENGFSENLPLELVAMDLKDAVARLGDITGKVTDEKMLDHIFGRFCIGK
jgi:tRNA modification GTPase